MSSKAHMRYLYNAFNILVANNKEKTLNIKDMHVILTSFGYENVTLAEVEQLVNVHLAYNSKNAIIDFPAFVAFLMQATGATRKSDEDVIEEFNMFDQDNKGYISRNDLVQVLMQQGGISNKNSNSDLLKTGDSSSSALLYSNAEIDAMIREIIITTTGSTTSSSADSINVETAQITLQQWREYFAN